MRQIDEQAFAQKLSTLGLSQADLAVALLWFRQHRNQGNDAAAGELGAKLHSYSLTGPVNISRLKTQLAGHTATVKGTKPDTFKLKLSQIPALDKAYVPLTGAKPPAVAHVLLPEAQTAGSRVYLMRISWQLNGSYEAGFYDGCAVMMRRLLETLLIAAFEHAKHGAAIKSAGDYLGFGEIIGVASSGRFIKLARGTGKVLERIKTIGDTAAHHPTYITVQTDIDEVSHEFRRVVSELMTLAGIHPASAP